MPAEFARAGRPALLLLTGFIGLAGTAAAGDSYESLRDGCRAAHAGDATGLTRCLKEAALEQNLRMDALYSALRADLVGDPARRLLNAQRAFVRFRDMHCTAIGRSVDATAWQACNLRLTLDRIAQLERYPEP